MTKKLFSIIVFLGLMAAQSAWAQVKAFPTAEGFGKDSIGGRGGAVIKVTNLNDSGSGSLRTALTTCGPRMVVFTVSGTINLTSPITLSGSCHSYLTVAGQTSPGGIQIKGADANINFQDGLHDVIFRHLRVRPGGPASAPQLGGFFMYSGSTAIEHIMLDHMSMMWTTDDVLQVSNNARYVTVQWSLLGEGLADGSSENYGPTFGIASNFVSAHHNLLAHNQGRTPINAGINFTGGYTDWVNNVIYNWVTNNAAQIGQIATNHSGKINIRKNHYIAGPDSSNWPYFWFENDGAGRQEGGTQVYLESNYGPLCPTGCASDEWEHQPLDGDAYYNNATWAAAVSPKYRTATQFSAPAITETAIASLKSTVTATVGAYKPSRDSVDTRIINDVNNGVTTSEVGYSVALGGYRSGANRYGGPWPDLAAGAPVAPTDTDGDGIPDTWETARGLNPNNASDGPAYTSNGYTNLENYLNELAGDFPGGYGAIWYVKKTGHDTNNDCTAAQNPSTPKLTIAGGISCATANASSIIDIGAGTYTENSIQVPASSSYALGVYIRNNSGQIVTLNESPFDFYSYTSAYVTIDGTNGLTRGGIVFDGRNGNAGGGIDGINIAASHYIRLKGVEIKGFSANGAQFTSSGNECLNCYIHDVGTTDFDHGIYINNAGDGLGQNNLVDGSEFTRASGAGVQAYANGNGTIIRNNYIHDTGGGLAQTAVAQDPGCTIWCTQYRGWGIIGFTGTTEIYNNVIAHIGGTGASLGISISGDNKKVYSNTIYDVLDFGIDVGGSGSGHLISNNIIVGMGQTPIYNPSASATYATNLSDQAGTGISIVSSTVRFADVSNNNYRLCSDVGLPHASCVGISSAINVGTDLISSPYNADIVGTARPQGAGWDIGAYEAIVSGSTYNTYYVATNGDDSRSCETAKTISTPKRNITGAQGGLSCIIANTGSSLILRSGTYTEQISTNNQTVPSGTSWANAATIKGYPGETVKLKNLSSGGDLVALQFVHYLIFENMIWEGSGTTTEASMFWCGENVGNPALQSSHIKLNGITVQNFYSSVGLQVYCHSNIFQNMVVKDNTFPAGIVGSGGYGFYVTGSDNLFERIKIFNMEGYGIQQYCNGCTTGYDPDRNVYRFLEIYNVGLTHPDSPAGILIGTGDSNALYSSIIRNNAVIGIGIGTGATNAKVYNNTVVGNAFAGIAWGQQSGGIVKNNILIDNGQDWFDYNGTAITRTNNRCDIAGEGCSTTAPVIFTDSGVNDYTLDLGSPMIGAGADVGLLCNSTCEIGAFETFTYNNAILGGVDASTIVISFQTAHAPILPASGCRGWTARVNTGGGFTNRSLTSCIRVGNAAMWLTLSSPAISSDTVTFSYAVGLGSVSDSILVGGTWNQRLFALTNIAVTNNIATGGGAQVWATEHFRCRVWPVAVAGSTAQDWLRKEDSNCRIRNDGGKVALPFLISCNGADCDDVGFQFYFCTSTSPCAPSAPVTDSCASNITCYNNTATATHGTQITSARLTNPEPAFVTGGVVAQDSSFPTLPLTQNSASELQAMLAFKAGAAEGTYVCVEPRKDGGGQITQNVTACIQLVAPEVNLGS